MGSTKEEIMTVALHLFAKNGYEAVSVSQIAGVLGMTKGALYRHYENKRDIFLHIVKRMDSRTVNKPGRMKYQKKVLRKCRKNIRTYQ